ncbi:Leucine-, glutamate- and lysine-rich protein 1 [Trichoplax sp. H2]|nr:Leucine-, glutamate- and lysine-rich protein 1 [Trichoplax sp. H2]|eukprot:RDD44090.1 Leucine-, glutamate- and lysine-rich protein 1 [Trichoplax sp. H2]
MDDKNDNKAWKRYDPLHPLPDNIQKMEKDETVCQYCGVSYLIHHEMKKLQEEVESLRNQLEFYQGSDERERQLKSEIEDHKNRYKQIENHLEEINRNYETTQSELTSRQQLETKLKHSNRILQKKLDDLLKEHIELKKKQQSLNYHLTLSKDSIAKQKEQLKLLKDTNSQCNSEMKTMLQSVKQEITNSVSVLTAKYSWQEEELKSVKQAKDEIDVEGLNNQIKQLQIKVQQLRKVEGDSQDLKLKYNRAELEMQAMKAKLSDFKDQINLKTSQEAQLQEQLRQINHLNDEIKSQLQKEKDNLKDIRQKHLEETEDIRRKLSEASETIQTLKEQRGEHEKVQYEFKLKASQSEKEHQTVLDLLKKGENEVQYLTLEREKMIQSHQNQIQQLRETYSEKLKLSESSITKMTESLQQEKNNFHQKQIELENRLQSKFQGELETIEKCHQEAIDSYKDEIKTLKLKLDSKPTLDPKKYNEEVSLLENLLQKEKSKIASEKDANNEVIKDMAAVAAKLKRELDHVKAVAQIESEKQQTTIQSLTGELDAIQIRCRSQQEDLKKAEGEIKFLQDTVQHECEERFDLAEALSSARVELATLKRGSKIGAARDAVDPLTDHASYIPTRSSKTDYNTAVNNITKATGIAVDDSVIYARPPSSSRSNKTPRRNNQSNVDDERRRIADAVRRHSAENKNASGRRL